jgi:hypothetical protein
MATETNVAEQYFQKNPNLKKDVIRSKRSLDMVAGKKGVEVTGSVLQYSLMSD